LPKFVKSVSKFSKISKIEKASKMTKLSQKSDFYTCSPIEFSEAKTPRIDQTEPIPVTIHWTSPIELIAELINLRAF
jgi:hypothetical protein